MKITFAITLIVTLRAGKLPSPIRALSLRVLRPAIAFELLAMVSILFSIYKSQTLIDMQSSAIYLIAMVLLVKITESLRDVERLLKGLALAGVLLAFGTLINFAGGRANMQAWNSNDIAYALVTLLPLVLVQRIGRSWVARMAVNGMALLMVIAMFLTGSRGGIIGLAVVVAGMSCVSPLREQTRATSEAIQSGRGAAAHRADARHRHAGMDAPAGRHDRAICDARRYPERLQHELDIPGKPHADLAP